MTSSDLRAQLASQEEICASWEKRIDQLQNQQVALQEQIRNLKLGLSEKVEEAQIMKEEEA